MSDDPAQLTQLLVASDPARRSAAAERLAQLGPDARDAAVALTLACGDPSELVREWAVASLEGVGPPRTSDIESLCSLVMESDVAVAYWAVTLLGRLRTEAAPATEALAEALEQHVDTSVRQRAAWALGKIGPGARAAEKRLGEAGRGDDPRLARLAGDALDRIRS